MRIGAGAEGIACRRPHDGAAGPGLRRSARAALVSGAVSTVFAAGLWALIIADPGVVLIVGAVLTTSRAITGFLIAAGIRLSRRHTRRFRAGLYKLENLIALIVGVMIVIGSYELGRYAVAAVARGSEFVAGPEAALAIMAIATVLALALGSYKLVAARAEHCVALRADANHSFVDAAGTGVLCIGLALKLAGVPIADAAAGAIVAVCAIWAGGSIAYQALKVLLDASVERSVLDKVREVATADPRVTDVLEVGGRNLGSYRYLTLRLDAAAGDVEEAEAIAADVKAAIGAQIANVDEVVVEIGQAAGGAERDVQDSALSSTASAGALADEAKAPSGAHGRLRVKPTEWAEIVSIIVSIAMATAMIAVAATAGSVAVLAEGTDTVVDVVASLVVLAGMRLAARHTKNFPLGLYKLENLVATGIGVLVLFSAYELGREAISRIVSGEETLEGPLLVIFVMAGVVAATAGLAAYKHRVGRKYGSPSLLADARHAWTDAFASAGVALGIGLQWAGIPYMDSVAALVVVALLAWGGVEVVLDGLRVLLDASLEDDVLQDIRRCAEAQTGVRTVVDVEGRNSGSYRFVLLRIVPQEADLAAAERTIDAVSSAVRTQVERIDRVTVELVAG